MRDPSKKLLTAKQLEVAEQVEALLGEHFDSFVVVYDVADTDDKGSHVTGGFWRGGHAVVAGMLALQQAKVTQDFIRDEVPQRPPEESA